uniref:Uncharacterized protein n=1 Tax=Phaeomonas parva TaxID=124430 RepID=A0A7S1UD27_9STRA|mmetsp:Transcript_39293/g.123022  ORF Transcript_39293/g.123022 Transcript_39293/m.123022 type:complete len:193 (+) Transcript_39293:455-1033(+)
MLPAAGVSIALALAGFILRAFVPMSGYWGASRRDEGALLVFCSCEAVNAFYFFMLFVSSILYEYYLTAGISFGIFFIHMASHHYGRRLYDRVKVRIDITNGFELVGRQPPVVAVPQAEAVAGQPLRYALATTIPVYEIGDDEDETKKGDRQAPAPLVTTSSTSPLVVRADTNHPCVPQGPHGAQSPHGVPLV